MLVINCLLCRLPMNKKELFAVLIHAFAVVSLLFLSACSSSGDKKTSKALFDTLDKANIAYSEGNWLEAEMYYLQIIEKVPNDAYAWLRVGNARLQTGKINASIAAYLESIRHNPDQPKPYYNLSTAYMIQAQRSLESAKQNMQKYDPGMSLVEQRIDAIKKLSTSKHSENINSTNSSGNNKGIIRYYMPSR